MNEHEWQIDLDRLAEEADARPVPEKLFDGLEGRAADQQHLEATLRGSFLLRTRTAVRDAHVAARDRFLHATRNLSARGGRAELGVPARSRMILAAQVAILALLVGWAYWLELYRVVDKWRTDGNWSHGWLVPLFSLYFLFLHRDRLARSRVQPNWVGLLGLVAAAGAYLYFLFITPMGYPRDLSLVMAVGAMVLFLGGWEIFRIAWFPVAFLLFAMPIPDALYVDLTMPLRSLASQVSAYLLSLVPGLYVDTSGVVIDYVYRGTAGQLNVEEACSGMRLTMAFVTLGAAMAYLGNRPLWQRATMVLACIPIAVFCNVLRVSLTGFLHVFGYEDWAEGTPHELLGLAMLPIALGLFALWGYLLSHLYVEVHDEEADGMTVLAARPREDPGGQRRGHATPRRPARETRMPGAAFPARRSLAGVPCLVCVTLLGMTAVMAGPLASHLKLFLIKDPIPLRKPLHELRRTGLGPYRFVQDEQFSASILEALRTDMYLNRLLEDTRQPQHSPRRFANLSVTYYTGDPNQVAHVPETCLRGAGYKLVQDGQKTLNVSSLAPSDMEVPTQIATFEKSDVFNRAKIIVAYTFHCNGAFTGSRTGVRLRITDPREKYAYFSKVEVGFHGPGGKAPTHEETVEATRDLFEYLLPGLIEEHWPDWEARAGQPQAAPDGPATND